MMCKAKSHLGTDNKTFKGRAGPFLLIRAIVLQMGKLCDLWVIITLQPAADLDDTPPNLF